MKCEINFFVVNISYVIRRKRDLRSWISLTFEKEDKVPGPISIILCDDDYLLDLNYKYLKHRTLTDILTFSSDIEPGKIGGDIYISLPRVRENAARFRQKSETELHRVMIHGILHLIGYNDSSKMEKKEMTRKEDFYLELFHVKQEA